MSRRTLLGVGLFCSVLLAAFESTAVITALPTIVDELNGRSFYGAALSANFLANLVAIVAAGEAADRRGPAVPFAVCGTLFVVGLLVAGAAPNIVMVVAGRALQGGGIGGIGALAYVGVRRGFPDEAQPRMYAVLSAGWVLPTLIAPFLSGAIVDRFGWRWVFLGLAPLAAGIGLLAVTQLRQLPPIEPPLEAAPSRVPAAARLTLGAGLVLAGLPSSRPLLAIVLVGVGLVIAAPALTALLPTGWARAAVGVPAVVLVRLCVTFAFNGIDAFVPLAADRIHHVSATAQGATIMGSSLTWSVGQVVAVRLHQRVSPHRLMSVGAAILAVGAASVLPVVQAATPLWLTFATWSVGGFGMGLIFNAATTFAMTSAGEQEAGLVSSQVNMADSLGYATVGGVGGAIVAWSERGGIELSTALVTTFVLAAAAAALASVVARRAR